jgi:hypothetical protein
VVAAVVVAVVVVVVFLHRNLSLRYFNEPYAIAT